MPETAVSSALVSSHQKAKLTIEHLSKVFTSQEKEVEALKDVSLTVHEGEFVVLVGPSGCGKSTLLNIIAGFESPTTGVAKLDNKPILKPGLDRLMMFQEHALFPWLNVIDNVMFGLRSRYKFSPRKRRRIARSFIRMVHLEEFEKALVHQLSGGMKHRVALARSLAPDPEILLVDEPFSALDSPTRAHLYQELQEILVETNKTILSVTHDSREAACLADRVIIFSPRPGRIIKEIKVDLPRPRDVNDPAVAKLAAEITSHLTLEKN